MQSKVKGARVFAVIWWLFMIAVAVSGGMNLGGPNQSPNTSLPNRAEIMLCLFLFIFGTSNAINISRKMNKPTWLGRQLDRLFGSGFAAEIMNNLHYPIWFPMFFVIGGSIGLLKGKIVGVDELFWFSCFASLSFGFGSAAGFFAHWLLWRRKEFNTPHV